MREYTVDASCRPPLPSPLPHHVISFSLQLAVNSTMAWARKLRKSSGRTTALFYTLRAQIGEMRAALCPHCHFLANCATAVTATTATCSVNFQRPLRFLTRQKLSFSSSFTFLSVHQLRQRRDKFQVTRIINLPRILNFPNFSLTNTLLTNTSSKILNDINKIR